MDAMHAQRTMLGNNFVCQDHVNHMQPHCIVTVGFAGAFWLVHDWVSIACIANDVKN